LVTKRNVVLATTWMKLENIVLSEKSQTPKRHMLYVSIYLK
jgi:hypothetical protein